MNTLTRIIKHLIEYLFYSAGNLKTSESNVK